MTSSARSFGSVRSGRQDGTVTTSSSCPYTSQPTCWRRRTTVSRPYVTPATRSGWSALTVIVRGPLGETTSVTPASAVPPASSTSRSTVRCAAADAACGSTPRSKRLDASEVSRCRRAVRAMETASKCAASTTTSVVPLTTPVSGSATASAISVLAPPITPARPIGPRLSVMTRSPASRTRFVPSRVVSFSPGSARRTPIVPSTRVRS